MGSPYEIVRTIALRIGALRFLYKKTLKRRDPDFDDLPLLKTPKKLPVVLSPGGSHPLIEAAPNLLYRTLLLLLYATGLRRAEVAHLKVSDIDRSLMLIRVRGRTLMRIDLAGGAPRALADLTGPWHGSWNQGGTILFQAGGITQISASGGPSSLLFDGGFPFFLPDGKRFLSHVNTVQSAMAGAKDANPHIELTALGAKEHTLILDDAGSAAIPAPTPGGAMYLLYARGANIMAQLFDLSSGKLLGEPTAILDDVGRVANPALMPALGVSPSGTLAFQRSKNQGDGRLTWYDRTGKPLASQAVGRGPVLSPDGQFAAVIRMDPSVLAEDIWVVDLKRGTSSRLTFARERDRVPVWSADGKRITFNRDGVGVFEKDASGAGA